MRRLDLDEGRPQHADANREEQAAKNQRGGGLEALVTERVLFVSFLLAVPVGDEYHEVGNEVRERVDAVGDEALGFGD